METNQAKRFLFPRWANYLLPVLVVAAVGGGLYVPVVVGLGASPKTIDVGYMPQQPVAYSHELHVGKLGLDCRYCHTTVDNAAMAAIPPTQTCMNCHTGIRTDSAALAPVRESWETGKPIEWIKVHDLPEFAYFNHSAHVNKGVGCVTCHGRVDQMEEVYQAKELSMAWCLDCHREPEKYLRPREQVTNMTWKATDHPEFAGLDEQEAQRRLGLMLKEQYHIRGKTYMESCSTCHR